LDISPSGRAEWEIATPLFLPLLPKKKFLGVLFKKKRQRWKSNVFEKKKPVFFQAAES